MASTQFVDRAALLRSAAVSALSAAPFKPLPREAAPTLSLITVSGTPTAASQISGAQTIYPINSHILNTSKFGFYGAAKANIYERSSTQSPQYNMVIASRASADTLGGPQITTVFNYVGAGAFELIRYGDGSTLDLWIDDVYVGKAAPANATGTAQAGGASSITLAAGASATTGYYNQCYARITGGTGVGQTRQITAYNGSTKVATPDTAWTTAPDATSIYSIDNTPIGFALDGSSGSLKLVSVTLPAQSPSNPVVHKITCVGSHFMGVNIGPNDIIWPGPPVGQMEMHVVSDSYGDGTSAPLAQPIYMQQVARSLGLQLVNMSSGSTGAWTRGANNRLNFLNRIAPPAEAWLLSLTATAGTFSISVTYNGVTSTTSAINWNGASASAVETALNALTFGGFSASSGVSWVGPTGQGCFCVARGDLNAPLIVIANGMVGATITLNTGSLTGTLTSAPYLGDPAMNQPFDAAGNALPFVLLVTGSGNDTAATGYTDAKLQANFTAIAQAIVTKFPTAIPVFTGIITNSDGGGGGTISSTDVGHNAAILAAAQLLPKINNAVPFWDTYANGIGGTCLFYGGGTVGAPTANKNDVMKSLLASGHPTGVGAGYLAANLIQYLSGLFRGLGF